MMPNKLNIRISYESELNRIDKDIEGYIQKLLTRSIANELSKFISQSHTDICRSTEKDYDRITKCYEIYVFTEKQLEYFISDRIREKTLDKPKKGGDIQ